MAGSIPPLVSSSPPPLNAFDEDDEEDDDEFGGYAVAEDIDYSECISFKENNGEKQNGSKSKRDQDNTSQDSATDSGLCPDSEGMSPTPHSDEERAKIPASILNGHLDAEDQNPSTKLNAYDEFKTPTDVLITNGFSEKSDNDDPSLKTENFTSFSLVSQKISPINNDNFDAEFGNFEFASTSSLEISQDVKNEENYEEFTNFESNPVSSVESAEKIIANGEHQELSGRVVEIDKNSPEICNGVNTNGDEEFQPFDNNAFQPAQTILEETVSNEFNCSQEFVSVEASHTQVQDIESESFNVNEVKSNFLNSDNGFDDGDDDEFDDFTDFKANFPNSDMLESEHSEYSEHSKSSLEVKLPEDCIKTSQHQPQDEASDDEFSNFADFSSSDCAFVSAQSSNSAENSSYIPIKSNEDTDLRTDSDFQDWVSVFPVSELDSGKSASDSCVTLLRADDSVWTRLMPLESSPALNYHWTDSLSNRSLLKALSIDSRNILWGVPRFAANLSCGVLQPMKALDPLQPSPVAISAQGTNAQETVPDAHFDWGSSGLINPLDCSHSSLLDLDLLMTLSSQLSTSPKPPALHLPKTLSAEAERILRSLPDLSYMRKSYIVFPISEGR